MQMAMEKTTQFSLACGLLTRMVKENQQGSFDGMYRSPPPTTMDFLSGIDASADHQSLTDATETAKPQLTIFYDGKMFVFDDFPGEKAKDLMQMASTVRPESCPVTTSPPAKLNHGTDMLAQTRKASLQRFLNKRKERINAMAPYQIQGSTKKKMGATAKPEDTRSWLALG